MPMTQRYAIYFAPAKSTPWWMFGAHWLGRDEYTNAPLAPPESLPIGEANRIAITSEPRHYGFHATLKAPFRLNQHKTLKELLECTRTLAAKLAPVPLGPLQAIDLGTFVALTPLHTSSELHRLASDCVMELEKFRAPLSTEEMARRLTAKLDARERELLDSYGYPFVLDRFCFHFSLTGHVDPLSRQWTVEALKERINLTNTIAPLILDRLCVFEEASPGIPFRRIADMPFLI